MKKNILVAGVLALSLSLGFTGCVPNNPEPDCCATISSGKPVDGSEEAAVSFRYQQFLDGAFKAEQETLEQLQEDVEKYGETPSEEDKEAIIDLMVEAFPSLDVVYVEEMTLDEKGAVYGSLITGSSLMIGYGFSIDAPKEAVTVDGDTATLDAKQLIVNAPEGEEFDATEITDSGPAEFIRVDGKWYLLVESLAPAEGEAPVEDAPVEETPEVEPGE